MVSNHGILKVGQTEVQAWERKRGRQAPLPQDPARRRSAQNSHSLDRGISVPPPRARLEYRGGGGRWGRRWEGLTASEDGGTFQKWKPDAPFKGEHILHGALLCCEREAAAAARLAPSPRPDGVTDNCIRRTQLFSIKRSCWRHNRGNGQQPQARPGAPRPPCGEPRARSFFRSRLIDVWSL